jgi:hypothetical protein
LKAPVLGGHPRMSSGPVVGGSRRCISEVAMPVGVVRAKGGREIGARARTCPPTRFPPVGFPQMNLLPPWFTRTVFPPPVVPEGGGTAADVPAMGSSPTTFPAPSVPARAVPVKDASAMGPPGGSVSMSAVPSRPWSPGRGWHERMSAWADEQARNWGAGYAERDPSGQFHGQWSSV